MFRVDPGAAGARSVTLDGPEGHHAADVRRLRVGERLWLTDGSGSAKDEHLVPGRGSQPCAELLERLARTGFDGHVVIEVNTRRAMSGAEREADLAEALAFTRLHLASAVRVPRP